MLNSQVFSDSALVHLNESTNAEALLPACKKTEGANQAYLSAKRQI